MNNKPKIPLKDEIEKLHESLKIMKKNDDFLNSNKILKHLTEKNVEDELKSVSAQNIQKLEKIMAKMPTLLKGDLI